MSNRVIIDQTINTVTTDQCPEINNSVVVNNDIPSTIEVTENVTNIVTVAVPGPQGPVGPAGSDANVSGSNYYIPVFSGSDSLVSSTIFQSGSFTSIRNATSPEDPTNPDILYVNGEGVDTYNLISAHSDINNYVQINVQNNNNSTEASSDIVATANNGTETDFYINMGINSEGFTNVGNVGGANDAYVYSTGNNLYIGNASAGKEIVFFNGGLDAENNANLWIHDQGTVGINTPTYNTTNQPSLQVEAIGNTTPTVIQVAGEIDNYSQVAITNRSGGNTASADLALYNNIDPTTQLAGFVDLGINSTNYVYNGIYPGSAGDAYLFTDSGHLVIGSTSGSGNAKVTLFAGGISESENAKLILYGNNQHEMTGSLNATEGFTGSLYGTASWALNVATSSNILGGQNNYVPLWSGSSSLTSSIIYQNGSAIGINNPIPSRTLDLISLQSGSYVSVASFMAPNNNIVGNTTQFYLGAQQATGNSISWTFNYQGNNSAANRMGFEFNGYATPVLSMFRNGNSVFGGAIDSGFKHDVQGTGRYTNNLTVTGSVTATTGFTGSLFGTSSWATNALSSSYTTNAVSSSYPIAITGSTIYSTGPTAGPISNWNSLTNAILLGSASGYQAIYANDSIFIGKQSGFKAEGAYQSNFIGTDAGYSASMAFSSNFFGYQAGYFSTDARYSNFFGEQAGYIAPNAVRSNFIGNGAGYEATNAEYSNFIGDYSGYQATNAVRSNFIGVSAGDQANSASYSTFIGYLAGANSAGGANGVSSNNIIIGTNITLAAGTKNSINLGGLIFATGSYATTTGVAFSGSTGGRVGINQPNPVFNLDVSGSGRYTNDLQVTGSVTATQGFTGSLFGTASWAQNALTASFGGNFTASNALINGTITAQTLVVQTITSSTDFVTGSTRFGSLLTNTHQFTGSVTITGSLSVNGSPVILTNQTSSMTVASASFATTASYALTASYVSGSSSTSISASYAATASIAVSSSYSLTASYALNAGGATSAFPFTGSALITGSLGVTGSIAITGSLNVGKTNIEFQENTNVTSGTWRVVSSEPTASYRAAFFDYVMFSGSIARAGTVYSVWSASYAEYYENYTGDVGGSTSGVTLQAAISGSNIQLQATASNSSWTIRSLVRML